MATNGIKEKFLKASIMIGCIAAGAGILNIEKVQAVTITFDDIPNAGEGIFIPNGYSGLNWNDMGVVNSTSTSALKNSGYGNGTVSGNNVAFNAFARPADVLTISSNQTFDFNSTYLTAAWREGLNIQVQGLLNGQSLYLQTVTVNSDAPTLFNFNFLGIDQLKFISFGGVENPKYNGSGAHFVMDNFTINEPTPVPEPLTILGTAVVLGFGVMCQRQSKKHGIKVV